ncbi:MAG: hypothetical protein ACI9G1_005034 [Pirellulaceae bacterium]|jgi:hypothetical protein
MSFPHSSEVTWVRILLVFSAAVIFSGCSQLEEPVAVPSFNANSVCEQAMKALDKDGDVFLSAEEVAACPALSAALATTDKDADKQISDVELKQRIREYRDDHLALMPFACQIMQEGKPVADARVKLVPASFMADTIKVAAATTGSDGLAVLAVAGMEFPGVQVGMYRVEISKLDDSGKETISTEFNTETKLGQEVASDVDGIERDIVFELK